MTNTTDIAALKAWKTAHDAKHSADPLHKHPVPPPPPPPTTARPFPAPVTTQTLSVPASVADLSGWFDANVRDGMRVEFPPDASYDLSRGLLVERRNHVVLRGNGTRLVLRTPGGNSDPGARASAFMLRDSHNIAIGQAGRDDFTVIGNNPDKSNIFVPGNEGQHVLSLNGWYNSPPSSNVEVAGVKATAIYGDGAYLEGKNGLDYAPSHHVWLHHNDWSYIGRNQVSSISVNDLLVEDNKFDKSGGAPWDIEPNYAAEQVRRNTFRRNTIGSFGHMSQFDAWFVVCAFVYATPVEDIRVLDNIVAGNPTPGKPGSGPRALNSKFIGRYTAGAGVRQKAITFSGNKTSLAVAGPAGADGVIYVRSADTVIVQRNVQPLTSGSFLATPDCTDVRT